MQYIVGRVDAWRSVLAGGDGQARNEPHRLSKGDEAGNEDMQKKSKPTIFDSNMREKSQRSKVISSDIHITETVRVTRKLLEDW